MTNGNPNGAIHLGAWANGSFTPLSGAAFGPGRNDVALTADDQVINANPRINGAVFWPASGYRIWNTGAVYYIGAGGYSWSSTAYSSDQGHYLQFNSTNIHPQYSGPRPYAFPVRCIRD